MSKNQIISTNTASLLPILNEQTSAEQSGCSNSQEPSMLVSRRLPPWLRQNLGEGGGHGETAGLIAELELENHALLRILGHRLKQLKKYSLAVSVFKEVLELREEEQLHSDIL